MRNKISKTDSKFINKIFWLVILILQLNKFSVGQNITNQNGWIQDLNYLIERLEIMHPNLYANVSKDVFYNRADEIRHRASNLNDVDFILEFSELVALVRDGHTKVSIESSNGDILRLFHIFPVRFYLFDDGLFILSCDKKYSKIVGKKVLKIGNLTVEQVIDRFTKIISADNNSGIIKEIQFSLNRPEIFKYIGAINNLDKINLVLEDENRIPFEYEIKSEPFSFRINHFVFPIPEDVIITMNEKSINSLPLYLKHPGVNYWYEYLPERKAIYLNIHYMEDKEDVNFKDFCMKMFKEFDSLNVQRLIIDIRNNVGGTNFFETPLMNGIWQRPEINNPEKLFLIIGRITFSAGQHLATQVTKYTKATLLGEATSGKPNHFGSSRRFQLPNSKLVIKCSIDDIQDSESFDWSIATWPDIFVPITSTDYERNFDPIIESIYNYNNLLTSFQNFEQILHQAYFAESVDGLIKKYFLLSDSIKKIGMKRKLLQIDLQNWLWENKKNMEDYTQYLFFLEKEFPDSFEVYYSLGIRMMNSDRLEEASDYFNKCLKLRPAHRYAKMNLKTIELNKIN